jgi:hypothetical protein
MTGKVARRRGALPTGVGVLTVGGLVMVSGAGRRLLMLATVPGAVVGPGRDRGRRRQEDDADREPEGPANPIPYHAQWCVGLTEKASGVSQGVLLVEMKTASLMVRGQFLAGRLVDHGSDAETTGLTSPSLAGAPRRHGRGGHRNLARG